VLDVNDNLVIILHALTGIIVFLWMVNQYSWKGKNKVLKGNERKKKLEKHELFGFYIFPATLFVMILAIIGNIIRKNEVDLFSEIIPSSLHGASGFIGTGLLMITWNLGRRTKSKREIGEKWNDTKIKHGRAADLILVVGSIHVFLGFLELLKIL